MIEIHPRLDINNLKITQSKIILGSFPIWSLTQIDSGIKSETNSESIIIKREGEFPFFYGSSTNKFWEWYKKYVDIGIVTNDLNIIKNSLDRNEIGITDVILSCKRKNKSALDKHLSERIYNHEFITYPKLGETLKILCTSKGVMNEMFLHKIFFKIHQNISINEKASLEFQNEFIAKIGGDINSIQKTVFVELQVHGKGIIQCIAIPSPGSPFRKLTNFGHRDGELNSYLDKYLKRAFNWFKS